MPPGAAPPTDPAIIGRMSTHGPQENPQNEPEVGADAVKPLELFFDLVFVFAISQLSAHLLEHLTWRGVAETRGAPRGRSRVDLHRGLGRPLRRRRGCCGTCGHAASQH